MLAEMSGQLQQERWLAELRKASARPVPASAGMEPLRESIEDKTLHSPRPVSRATARLAALPRRRWGWWLTGSAAAILFLTALVFQSGRQRLPEPAAVAELEQVQGEVYVLDQDAKTLARPGQKLFPGQSVQVGEEGLATVAYADATKLSLSENTTVRWPGLERTPDSVSMPNGKSFFLANGAVAVNGTGAADTSPLLLTTPHAEIASASPRFNLWNTTQATHIEMEHGTAQVRRRRDGRSIQLSRGTQAEVSFDDPQLAAVPLTPRPDSARMTLRDFASEVFALAFAPDGSTLASGHKDGTVRLWDLATGQEQAALEAHADVVRILCFSPSGSVLATAGDDKLLNFCRIAAITAPRLAQVRPGPATALQFPTVNDPRNPPRIGKRTSQVLCMSFAGAGATLTTGHWERSVKHWDVASGDLSENVRLEKPQTHQDLLASMTLAPAGNLLAWGSKDHAAVLWDLKADKKRHVFHGHTASVTAVAFSPDGKILATGSRDRTVRLWDVVTGKPLAVLSGGRGTILCAAFSPDGSVLAAAGSDAVVKLWDPATGKEQAALQGHKKLINALAFSPDGKTLATSSSDKTVKLWNLPLARPRAGN